VCLTLEILFGFFYDIKFKNFSEVSRLIESYADTTTDIVNIDKTSTEMSQNGKSWWWLDRNFKTIIVVTCIVAGSAGLFYYLYAGGEISSTLGIFNVSNTFNTSLDTVSNVSSDISDISDASDFLYDSTELNMRRDPDQTISDELRDTPWGIFF